MKREIMRKIANEYCTLEIKLENGRLSICGHYGHIVTESEARKLALEYWQSHFDDEPGEIMDMNKRCGTRFTSSRGAAKYVLSIDGEYHGLDVDREEDNCVYLLESCGQIHEELVRFFPEAKPYLKWHSNDMRAECEHQELRGETWKTHPNAICPDCRYKLGSAWTKRELPSEVIQWAGTFGL